ncbi:glycosyltransferase family 25 protein [Shewanella sp. SR44-3]|uniref:glycosyltransferase family 25 protein n=1 Tax=unclassified Shewanella TaxID=196818 RepID=UPI0015FCC4E2|nr:glycosyltransferase family 25 protein [Shewanella sp. SR44-3]MBB1268429.1 glycosyltransferase family 25 protein [Shewanella sp. SR44-3]
MSFKIFVINLDSSVDRIENMQAQCAKLGIEFERVSAVRGKNLSKDEKAAVYNRDVNLAKYDKELNDGEIGCYMSHARCWEQIVAQDLDYALILEDDAILTPEITSFIAKLAESTQEWDYIKLSHGRKPKNILNAIDLGDGLSLGQCIKLPSTTTGQFVSLTGAKKLLQHAYPIARPIDIDIQFWYEKSLRSFVVRPFPILNGDFGSEINQVTDRRQVDKRQFARIWQKIKFELNLLINRGRLGALPKSLLK